MSETERTYTLAEAERELRLRDCRMYGHKWKMGPVAMCEVAPRFIVCARCGETRDVAAPGELTL